jgi:hypothetical protein
VETGAEDIDFLDRGIGKMDCSPCSWRHYDGVEMASESNQSASALVSLWGIVWIIATLAGPLAVMLMMPVDRPNALVTWVIRVALALHMIASIMIARTDALGTRGSLSVMLAIWLVLSGWLLMISVYLIGCAVTWDFGQWTP